MKKICFIIDSMMNSGGRERVVSILSEEFVKKYKVEIIVLDNSSKCFYRINKNVNIFPIIGKNKIQKLINLHKYLKKNEGKIYITLSMRFLNLFVAMAAMFTRAEIIATEHCDYFTTPTFFRFLKRIFYKKYRFIITLTEKDKNIIKKWFKNVEQINNPTSFSTKYVSTLNNKVLLNVGRLTKQKGQDMLIEAWNKVKRDDWKLIIVGDGELKEELLNKISKFGLKNTVEIKPPTSNIQELYLNADIFVLSSRWEGLPMVLIEAMTCGLPCVSFDCETGPKQLIKDDCNGYLVKPNNINDLAIKMQTLMSNSGTIKKFSYNSIMESKKYEIKNISRKWDDIFNTLDIS